MPPRKPSSPGRPARRTRKTGGVTSRPPVRFGNRLILVHWLLELLGEGGFDSLKERLSDPSLELIDSDGATRFHKELLQRTYERPGLPDSLLRVYDQNIVRHWRRLVENRRDDTLRLKYFQYLSLLFTEIYLDRYFGGQAGLLDELNGRVDRYNAGVEPDDALPRYEPSDLNKIAFWMATGSGKTLLMHVHIMQYLHYLRKHRRERELNRIILLTPNEGLSRQHLDEFTRSGLAAELFSDQQNRFLSLDQQPVEIIEITRLSDTKSEKLVPVEAFEGNNLVLVDEGHRGASASRDGTWMRRRNALCETGFSFEYSATFGQAVSGNKELSDDYARCILFDYSYRYFYGDGYGKDYLILNLAEEKFDENRETYLTAALLTFFEQLLLFVDKGRSPALHPFNLERPLWVFVGGRVTENASQKDVSDVEDILQFLDRFVKNQRGATVRRLETLLSAKTGLLDRNGHELFGTGRFPYLHRKQYSAERLFQQILKLVFNASAHGVIHADRLGKASGEIGLRIGENRHFGVINIGDAPALMSGLAEKGFVTGDRQFDGSLFAQLNKSDELHVLIGSKKFSEGWNSFRVASLGLMNVGKGEGSQIIQLFGRGVRLKGFEGSLKRSSMVPGLNLQKDVRKELQLLETLNIFGIQAAYMEEFRDRLEEEGVPSSEEEVQTVVIRTKQTRFPDGLKIPSIGDYDFKDKEQGERPVVQKAGDFFGNAPVPLDWYPVVQMRASGDVTLGQEQGEKHEGKLEKRHRIFLDYDRLYFDLIDYKNECGWFNLNISRDAVKELLEDPGWYRLLIPPSALDDWKPDESPGVWEEVALALLKKYCDRFYRDQQRTAEDPHREFTDLGKDSQFAENNIYREHVFSLTRPPPVLLDKLQEMKKQIEGGNLSPAPYGPVAAVDFDRHLYRPLFFVKKLEADSDYTIDVDPLPLNAGEREFVDDLRTYCAGKPDLLSGRELYLLRNQSRGRGLGFCEAEGFHPDFFLWILDGDRQYLTFVDPKGLRHIQGDGDPKLNFYRKIKEIQAGIRKRTGNDKVIMNSFIVSVTPPEQLSLSTAGKRWMKQDYLKRNILFPRVDRDIYINKMLETVLGAEA